ncbi:MAG TPA: peptide chain release factor N(5)-glutamine methyltransferase [Opitutaceae bacterium]|jgi:release factor glutamine methyltransferase
MMTVLEVVRKTAEFFSSKGIEAPRLNAELLVGHALSLPRMRLYLEFERPVSETELGVIREYVRRRGRHEPVQHIIGFTDFHGLRIKTDRRALIPRPETEFLAEIVVGRWKEPPRSVLDLGTGTGVLALALAKAFPSARVTAVDASRDALALASENAEAAGLSDQVTFLQSDWFQALPAGDAFDLVVSNPPYLSVEETAAASPEVRDFEPGSALTAGDEGFAELARIIAGSVGRFAPGGMLALECGTGHRPRLESALGAAGFVRVEALNDLAGRPRYVLAWR